MLTRLGQLSLLERRDAFSSRLRLQVVDPPESLHESVESSWTDVQLTLAFLFIITMSVFDVLQHQRLRVRSVGECLCRRLDNISLLLVLFELRHRHLLARVTNPARLTTVGQHVAVNVGDAGHNTVPAISQTSHNHDVTTYVK